MISPSEVLRTHHRELTCPGPGHEHRPHYSERLVTVLAGGIRDASTCAPTSPEGLCLLWVFTLASQDDRPENLYVADRSLSPVFNGFALAGEFITVVALFAISGAIALFGYDGFASAVDSVLALGALLLLAGRIRASGHYTLGGLFSLRASGRGPRTAAAVVTLVITIPLLIVQLRAAGISAALLIGMSSNAAQVLCTVLMGCLVTCFAGVADLRGTSFVQVVKVPVTLVTLAVVALLALRKFSWSPGALLSAAVEQSTDPDAYLSRGSGAHGGPRPCEHDQ
ncbi:hypothetical protein O1L60_35145 [Streptomyces diastatochromogenes]|nr:hypothetical protein [Streptomyces diastatochromogenes]